MISEVTLPTQNFLGSVRNFPLIYRGLQSRIVITATVSYKPPKHTTCYMKIFTWVSSINGVYDYYPPNLQVRKQVTRTSFVCFLTNMNLNCQEEKGLSRQEGFMNSKNANHNDIALNRSLGKVRNLGGLCYMPLPVGHSKHVYLNLPESTAVTSFLPKVGFQYQTKESHGYLFS